MDGKQWLPIERAKQDGTFYVLGNPDWSRARVGLWTPMDGIDLEEGEGEGWYTEQGEQLDPTHFMEMPDVSAIPRR